MTTQRIYMEIPTVSGLPEHVLWCGKGTWMANPFRPYEHCPDADWGVEDTGRFREDKLHGLTRKGAYEWACKLYRTEFNQHFPPEATVRMVISMDLGGKKLGCNCPLELPCHVDYLVEVAALTPVCRQFRQHEQHRVFYDPRNPDESAQCWGYDETKRVTW